MPALPLLEVQAALVCDELVEGGVGRLTIFAARRFGCRKLPFTIWRFFAGLHSTFYHNVSVWGP